MSQDEPSGPRAESTGCPQIDWGLALAEHDHWLRVVVLARVGDPQAVGDVMQEVSLAAVRQRKPLQNPAKIAPWLYRVAVRQSVLYRRTQGRRRKLADRIAQRRRPELLEIRNEDPLNWLLASERRQLIREALQQLSGRDAEILLLKYTEDWSYRQLAEHLEISPSAVEARLHRARTRLRAALHAKSLIEAS